jgi:hypothetical protein
MVVDGSTERGGNNGCERVVMSGNKDRWGAAGGRYILDLFVANQISSRLCRKTQGETTTSQRKKWGAKRHPECRLKNDTHRCVKVLAWRSELITHEMK